MSPQTHAARPTRDRQLNLKTYEKPNIVEEYAAATQLFGAERAIIERFGDRLAAMDMLDIGVGGGRTTGHFGPLVRNYVGTDYAPSMVAACEKRFNGRWPFFCCDARDMRMFADNSFDFALFSFNGIDYVSHVDRLKILREIRRVIRPGGYFAFSTHNLDNAERYFSLKLEGGVRRLPANLARYAAIHALNLGFLLGPPQNYARINDGVYRFGLRTYYVRPPFQIEQLRDADFGEIRIFSQHAGVELTEVGPEEPAPYYLCEVHEKQLAR